MRWEFSRDIVVEWDGEYATLLSHVSYPFEDAAGARDVDIAVAYLSRVKDPVGVTDEQLDWLRVSGADLPASGKGKRSTGPGAQLRWRERRRLRDDTEETSILSIQQTYLSPPNFTIHGARVQLDVYEAGLRIVIHRLPSRDGWRVTGLVSTLHRHFNLSASTSLLDDSPMRVASGAALFEEHSLELLKRAGLPPPDVDFRADGTNVHLWLVRSVAARGEGEPSRVARRARDHGASGDTQDYVAIGLRALYGSNDTGDKPLASYDVIGTLPNYTLLLKTPLSTHVDAPAQVYPIDPASQLGTLSQAKPNGQAGELNKSRQNRTLRHLLPPAADGLVRLQGENVFVLDPSTAKFRVGSIGLQPPKISPGGTFDFSARTNDFAAANAYYHCDRMFALATAFGMAFSKNPMGFGSPVEVIHRAAIHPGGCGDGRCIDAQATVVSYYDGINQVRTTKQGMQLRFALADLSLNPGTPQHPVVPLGVACDQRWVWHEFSHVLIAGSTDLPEFEFAHSAGDALAAIMSDPYSELAPDPDLRGLTFPWTAGPNRQHNRCPEEGWSWSAPEGKEEFYHADLHDMFGYVREQILSSTLFILYRAIGGDAVHADGTIDGAARRASAHYTAYLIFRAINSLGRASTTPAWHAAVFAAALMDADAGTLLFQFEGQTRLGGCVWKVIRWAFETFGLYLRDPAKPNPNGSGDPPRIDVYIEDGRGGCYLPLREDETIPSTEVWNRYAPDGLATHQPPKAGLDNFIYVRAGNRGYDTAQGVQAAVFITPDPGSSLTWDRAAWEALSPASLGADQGTVASGSRTTLGPFKWHPPVGTADFAILAALHHQCDPANIDLVTGLPCAFGPTPLAQVVRFDNNLGLSRWPTI